MANPDPMRALRQVLTEPIPAQVHAARAAGRPIIGHFCTYTPTQLIAAAGATPLRLRGVGSQDSGPADAFMSSRTCTYVRHTLALALDGAYDALDGVVCLNTCDHVRRAADLWRHKTQVGFVGFLSVPRSVRESLYGYYREQVDTLLAGLRSELGLTVEPEAIRRAQAEHAEVMDRLARLDTLRSEPAPRLSGEEALVASVAARLIPADDFCALADALLAEREQREPGDRAVRARVLLAGGELDEPAFLAALEAQGVQVAADSLCCGMRAPAAAPEKGGDPIDAVCRQTFFQTSCARMIGNFTDRLAAMLETLEQRKLDGVIFQRIKFCDPWGGEGHNLRRRLAELDIPLLILEREYGQVNPGQVSTRVQAFCELLEARARRRRAGRAG